MSRNNNNMNYDGTPVRDESRTGSVAASLGSIPWTGSLGIAGVGSGGGGGRMMTKNDDKHIAKNEDIYLFLF